MVEQMKLPRQRLRAMQDRWQRDYDTLESTYGDWMNDAEADGMAYIETMRNLITAIAMINGMITAHRRGDGKEPAQTQPPSSPAI